MSLLFRAIWGDDRVNPCDAAFEIFAAWTAAKTHECVEIPQIGKSSGGMTRSVRDLGRTVEEPSGTGPVESPVETGSGERS